MTKDEKAKPPVEKSALERLNDIARRLDRIEEYDRQHGWPPTEVKPAKSTLDMAEEL